MTRRETLPIDALLPAVVDALREAQAVVVEAPPGAGKTTRVPPALLEADITRGREIWVLEPRRIAARMSARRVAEELGERPGETVGYQVRFDEVAGPRTAIRFVTEGVLTRKLLADPSLDRVGAVVLDEFHERHLQADLALALLKRLQLGRRPDLRIVAMSATLDAAPVAAYLGCPVLTSEGRRFDVAIEHLPRPDERPLAVQVADALRRLLDDGLDGDVLVFLPGAAEIRRALEACEPIATRAGLLALPLHGELPPADQDRAVRPADRPRVILSTNVAETSVTIEGVVAVIDSGLARIAGHSPWTGLPTLALARVSQASAVQRAGRAGRTRPGRCLRLFTAQDFNARPLFEEPEVRRLDLAEAALELHAAGVGDLAAFDWFEAPAEHALEAADTLLRRLGAIDASAVITEVGRSMLRTPLHPRLSRLLVEAEARGVGEDACLLAALIGERDIRERHVLARYADRTATSHGPSDLLEMADRFAEAKRLKFDTERLRALGLDPVATRAVERVRGQLLRLLGRREAGRARALGDDAETALMIALLAGFPDRVARRRRDGQLVLANGSAAELAPESVVRRADFLVAVAAEERRAPGGRRGTTLVRLSSAIEPDWLLDLFPADISEATEVRWNARDERVEVSSRLLYDEIAIDESHVNNPSGPEVTRVLAEAAIAAGPAAFSDTSAIDSFLARATFASAHAPEAGIPPIGDREVLAALEAMCEGRRSFAELRAAARTGDLLSILRGRLTTEQARTLETLAPERVRLAGGRNVRINYDASRLPWIASRLQDFFGMREGPRVAGGRVALVLHLLAPNNRPVQVTSDLAGFWERHYPQVRRELGRRYPKHKWPEDPLRPSEARA